jgi:hypothetical protein
MNPIILTSYQLRQLEAIQEKLYCLYDSNLTVENKLKHFAYNISQLHDKESLLLFIHDIIHPLDMLMLSLYRHSDHGGEYKVIHDLVYTKIITFLHQFVCDQSPCIGHGITSPV